MVLSSLADYFAYCIGYAVMAFGLFVVVFYLVFTAFDCLLTDILKTLGYWPRMAKFLYQEVQRERREKTHSP